MANTLQLEFEPLTAQAFADFGEVVQTDGAQHFSINGGKLQRFYNLATVDIRTDVDTNTEGRPIVSIANCLQCTELPLPIDMLERHPLGSQMIFPLHKQAMIVVVAPKGEMIAPDSIRAFYSNGKQGINFYAGTWHLPIIALQAGQAFILFDRGGEGNNCQEYYFSQHEDKQKARQVEIILPELPTQAA